MNLGSWSKSDDAAGAQSPPGSSAVLSELSTLYKVDLRDSQKLLHLAYSAAHEDSGDDLQSFRQESAQCIRAVHF